MNTLSSTGIKMIKFLFVSLDNVNRTDRKSQIIHSKFENNALRMSRRVNLKCKNLNSTILDFQICIEI